MMSIEELIHKLKLADDGDPEGTHVRQDNLLLEYINDQRVTDVFESSGKWYA